MTAAAKGAPSGASVDDLERAERDAYWALSARVHTDPVLARMWDRWQDARRARVLAELKGGA